MKLASLRHALPQFSRDVFDSELQALRRAGEFSLDSHEGLHGTLTTEEREAGENERDEAIHRVGSSGGGGSTT